eukprot:380275_1
MTLQRSISFIMASNIGLGAQYQLLIYNTVQGVYGFINGTLNGSPYPIIVAYIIRLNGSRYLGAGQYKTFRRMLMSCFVNAILFGLIAFVSILVFHDSLPYYYASNTLCKYAENESTMDVFNSIFHKIDIGMVICALICFISTIFCVLQAVLYATLDFKFMRNS